jgi:hypothetical protein
MLIAQGKEQVELVRLRMLYMGLRAESVGMKLTRGRSALAICKSEFGWKGSRATIIKLLVEEINKRTTALAGNREQT